MGPIFKLNDISFSVYVIFVILVGILFGAILERSGFISTKKLTGTFLFDDFAVLKVMFSAIIVTMIGLYFLADINVIEIAKVYFGKTYWISQLVGGILFGIGFMLSGYCPGTSVVSVATGSIDALVVVLGAIAGMWVFGFGFKIWEGLYKAGNIGKATLPKAFGVNHWVVIIIITIAGLGMFYAAEWREKKIAE